MTYPEKQSYYIVVDYIWNKVLIYLTALKIRIW